MEQVETIALERRLFGSGHHVGGGQTTVVVHPEHPFLSGDGHLLDALRDLDRRGPLPFQVVDRHQLVDASQGRRTVRRDETGADPERDPRQQGGWLEPIPGSFRLQLGQDLPDHQLVEVRGENDRDVVEPRLVQQHRSLDGQVSQVAGVDPDAHRSVTRPAQLLEDDDGVGYTRLNDIDRVDQQDTLVRVDLGEHAKGIELGATEGDESLHHGVGMGPFGVESHRV